jgi:two-component system OmpR family response regulator
VNQGAARVLVIEDDPSIRLALEESLREEGYHVRAEPDGSRLEESASLFRPDIAILDVRLRRGPQGFELGRKLRTSSDVPLLFLTAADSIEDRLAGFQAGGDDYLVKPFSMAELLARIQALLRRSGRLTPGTRTVGDLVLDERAKVAVRAGTLLELTPTEYDLVATMSRSPGRVFSKVQLLNQIWGFDAYDPNVVEVHISSLRQKLEAHGPRVIHTERGRGYVFRA